MAVNPAIVNAAKNLASEMLTFAEAHAPNLDPEDEGNLRVTDLTVCGEELLQVQTAVEIGDCKQCIKDLREEIDNGVFGELASEDMDHDFEPVEKALAALERLVEDEEFDNGK